MKYFKIFPPIALRIYQVSLSYLMDQTWRLTSLPELTNNQIERHLLPNDLFIKTIRDGFLYYLGTFFFDRLFDINDDVLFCDAEDANIAAEYIFWLLSLSGLEEGPELFELMMAIDEVDTIVCETPKNRQNSVFHRKELHIQLQDALWDAQKFYENDIKILQDNYARNFAERALHDRQICEFITYSLSIAYGEKGYPVIDKNDQLTFSKVERRRWPTWVKPTLLSRDRNLCANCGLNFGELQGRIHIDHIVPLSQGGCNDIVNLQLLCSNCNTKKHNNLQLVNSSIPEYFRKLR